MSAMSETLSYGLLVLVVGLALLVIYALSLLKSIQQESSVIRDHATQIRTQGDFQKEAMGRLENKEVDPNAITAGIAGSGPVLKGAVLDSLREINFSSDIEGIRSSAQRIGAEVADINKIFLDHQEAAGWAEKNLEECLKDSFANVHIRKNVAKLGKTPDAHLKLNSGKLLCVDSKFPVKSFKAMIPESDGGDGAEDGRKRVSSETSFIAAIKTHFDKVATDYVRPDLGTTEVAYLYVASERIYHHMVNPDNTEECEIVRDAANKGVILCSPSTLIANMHLVRVAERAMGIAGDSDKILRSHDNMRRAISELVTAWATMSKHVNNAQNQRVNVQDLLDEVERSMKGLEGLDLSGDED
ncbi:uncharacterized protein METZ01_LOCUS113855 [marine metagenome]|uniref:DNA recombination protein RmuC n=1 Tax=marine metagenome TaxID=408172 RepID=A0A381X936_9ZZZZ